jgi:flagellar hook-length control protein FliK
MVTAINAPTAVAPAPATPATPAAPNEPGAFARELDRAAQAGDAESEGAAAATAAADQAPVPPGTSTSARAKARAAVDGRGADPKTTHATVRQQDAVIETTAENGKEKSDAPGSPALPDLQALLAGLNGLNGLLAPAPTPPNAQAGTADSRAKRTEAAEAAEAAKTASDAGRTLALPAAGPTGPQAAEAASTAAVALPAFALPQAASAPAAPAEAAPPAPVHQAQVSAALGTPEFAPGLSAEVNVMLRDGLQEARLQLNPAEMGPITVQIQIEGTHARISLSAEQAPTRDALEQALPTLASTLRDSGLTLTGGGVFEQPRPPRDDKPLPTGSNVRAGDDVDASGVPGVTDATGGARRLSPRGVVDLYA